MSADLLKPYRFQPGQSGNPGGRPKAAARMAQLIRDQTRDGEELVEFALAVLRGGWPEEIAGEPRPPGTPPRRTVPVDEKSRRWAADWLSDRGFGKPMQDVDVGVVLRGVEVTPELQALVEALKLSPHERRERIAELKAKALAAAAKPADAERD